MSLEHASRTALSAAAHRAAHQLLEQGSIFSDPLALRILGDESEGLVREAVEWPHSRRMRLLIAARTRFAEDALGTAVERGLRQLVVLGAGLDTYGYRGSHRDQLQIFEVDHPATQTWKRERLTAAGIPIPAGLSFVAVDFERDEVLERLVAAGFDPRQPAFFTWLGVVPYLAGEDIWRTLAFIAALPGGASVVFDYGEPTQMLAPEARSVRDEFARRVAELGEPWVSFFDPAELHGRLGAMGFGEIEDHAGTEIVAHYLSLASTAAAGGAHVVRATSFLS